MNEERSRIEELRRPGVDVGPIALQPKNFWPHGLRGQRVSAAVKYFLGPDRLRQILDFLRRPRIDPIENRVRQRRPVGVDWQHAGADRARSDRRIAEAGTLLSA